jgi:RNA polymerase sigma-70 factor, ECF subfamily
MTGDSEITGRIRKGDIKQFESLFRSSYVSLVRYARMMVTDHDTSEEIVQDLFFRLWRDRATLRIESSLNGYLYRAVHNSCIHLIEHKRIVARHAASMPENEPESAENPAELLQYKELQAKIADILDHLPQRCGQIFCMNRFEGLKYNEIASRLSISVKTVEADMGKALKVFRKELAQQ